MNNFERLAIPRQPSQKVKEKVVFLPDGTKLTFNLGGRKGVAKIEDPQAKFPLYGWQPSSSQE